MIILLQNYILMYNTETNYFLLLIWIIQLTYCLYYYIEIVKDFELSKELFIKRIFLIKYDILILFMLLFTWFNMIITSLP